MTDPVSPAAIPDAAAKPKPGSAAPPARVEIQRSVRRQDLLPLVYLVALFVLGGALLFLWTHPPIPAHVEQAVAQDTAQVDALQRVVADMNARVAQMESRPAPQPAQPAAPVNLAPLDARIAALERRPAPADPAAGLAPLADRLTALERRSIPADPAAALAALAKRIDDLEHRPVPVSNADAGQLATRMDGVAARQDTLAARQQADASAADGRVGTVEARLAVVERQAGQVQSLSDRAGRLSRIQAAAAALDAGQKLGSIPGGPPALARFADQPAPGEAQLRRSFIDAAEAAHRASQPALMDDQPLATRLWNRAQQVVTVRQGDRVLLGDPVAGVLARARQALDAGDLPAAVKALDGLAGPAAEAMAPWRAQAQSLLDARAALADLAARG